MLAAALSLLAVPATAGPGSTATATAPLAAPGFAEPAARCPSGSHATGGGFKVAGGYNPKTGRGAQTLTQSSSPSGPRGWGVHTTAFGPSRPTTLTEHVLCASNGSGNVTIATESATLLPGRASTIEARCPPLRRLVGGGFSVVPPRNFADSSGAPIFVLESRRQGPRDWQVTAANVDAVPNATDGTVTAYALCAGDVRVMRSSKATVKLRYGRRATATAKCPLGYHTVSGGFRAWPAFDTASQAYILPFFDASAPLGPGAWQVSAFRSELKSTPAAGKITAYAYCEAN